jgi:hypothetical protein
LRFPFFLTIFCGKTFAHLAELPGKLVRQTHPLKKFAFEGGQDYLRTKGDLPPEDAISASLRGENEGNSVPSTFSMEFLETSTECSLRDSEKVTHVDGHFEKVGIQTIKGAGTFEFPIIKH